MKISIEHLTKKYDGKLILDQLSLKLDEVGVISIIGPSGGGKSTLLRLLAGLEEADEGRIQINDHVLGGENTLAYRKKVGFVFQDHNLFDHLTVLDNLLIVLEKVHQMKRDQALEVSKELLEQFGLLEHMDKYPHQISGGQAQRVSIVRALSISPELILLDEPTSSLDPILTYEVLEAIKRLREDKKDFIIVTHEIGFAKHIAEYILFVDEGHILEHGTREILEKPKTSQLTKFLEKVLTY